jgi:hypothetical protein
MSYAIYFLFWLPAIHSISVQTPLAALFLSPHHLFVGRGHSGPQRRAVFSEQDVLRSTGVPFSAADTLVVGHYRYWQVIGATWE